MSPNQLICRTALLLEGFKNWIINKEERFIALRFKMLVGYAGNYKAISILVSYHIDIARLISICNDIVFSLIEPEPDQARFRYFRYRYLSDIYIVSLNNRYIDTYRYTYRYCLLRIPRTLSFSLLIYISSSLYDNISKILSI